MIMIRLDRLNRSLTFSNGSKKLINYFESVNKMLMSTAIRELISDLMKIPTDQPIAIFGLNFGMFVIIFVVAVIVLWFIAKFISYKPKDDN